MPNPSLLTPAQLQAIRERYVSWPSTTCTYLADDGVTREVPNPAKDVAALLAHIEALEQELAAARQHMLSERDLAKLLNAALRGAPAPDQA